MQTLLSVLENKTSKAIEKAFQGRGLNIQPEIALCLQPEHGHYQSNSALKLAKLLQENPRSVANQIISHLDFESILVRADVAGPGFINFVIHPDYLSKKLQIVLEDPYLGVDRPKHKKKIIVEFSSPNVAKELHVGHLRSTIIGDCIARLFEFLGHDVLRLNHVGDWGTQFGMLIAYIKQVHPEILEQANKISLSELMDWYKQSKARFDVDSSFKKTAQKEVVSLQKGVHESIKIWKAICEISRKAFLEIYDLLDVKLQERGESFYNPYLAALIDEAKRKKLLQLSDGAKCIYPPGFTNKQGDPLPLMIQKSDGGYNYDTTDLAALKHRLQAEKADRVIVVVDAGQSLHFQLVFQAAQMMGFYDPKEKQVEHVPFGLVLGPNGKKFKTRSGETEKLIDLLYGAIDAARKLLDERLPDIEKQEKEYIAKTLGISAIKYADLSSVRTKDYLFSYKKMLRFEGNTAVFLLYAYVRIMGIKRKANVDLSQVDAVIQLSHPSEISLGLHLLRFSEVLQSFERDLLPNRLADYLYELAEKFNVFFRDCKVVGESQQNPRLLLCEICGKILKQGLQILGIKTLDRM